MEDELLPPEALFTICKRQYSYLKESRQVLIDFCGNMQAADFQKTFSEFSSKSIRDLLVHVANTYHFWIGQFGLQQEIGFADPEAIFSVEEARLLYVSIDRLMEAYLLRMQNPNFHTVEFRLNGGGRSTSPLRLFTHVITHEFHHKGQLLLLGRLMGYIPVDTDIMR